MRGGPWTDEECDVLTRRVWDGFATGEANTRTLVRAAVEEAQRARHREWSNRIQSQDTLHPDSPDLDIALAWYLSQNHGPLEALRKERDEARRLHDHCCGHGTPCIPPWRKP
jgi:hypothetical protein